MGDAKRRKKMDPNYGKSPPPNEPPKPPKDDDSNMRLIRHEQAMTKRLTEPVYVHDSLVKSIHMGVCLHPDLFNRGFCQIETQKHKITLWLDKPFEKRNPGTGNPLDFLKREWYGTFRLKIVNREVFEVDINFSMQSLPDLKPDALLTGMFSGEAVDKFVIDGLVSTAVSVDSAPEDIILQAPLK
ncbi:hypothetical protein [Laspinema olomoucense]|uniref:hypothetical protein n=1 Tax=Laspinema olomoucense TaxID=3231600 RepID=UPI0021BA80CA|nr:hypothetical protein [Laspinema sp. D3a]MCT7989748.1 hypothetical protein [Laspinema sp. D3a]